MIYRLFSIFPNPLYKLFFIFLHHVLFSRILSQIGKVIETDSIVNVKAINGKASDLPCHFLNYSSEEDRILLILWYKLDGETGIPIYTFDVRGRSLNQASHQADLKTFGGRGYFNVKGEPSLQLQGVERSDEGSYICRVDFKKSPSKYTLVNVTVIVPSTQPLISTEPELRKQATLRSYLEDETLKLYCSSSGRPPPRVVWWKSGEMIDSSFESRGEESINEIWIPHLTRADVYSQLSCHSSNTNETKIATVTLDMHLRPLFARILKEQKEIPAGKSHVITCEVVGSKPTPNISWFQDQTPLSNSQISVTADANVTRSSTVIVPTFSDNGKNITCKAVNDYVKRGYAEDCWVLNVTYVPQLELKMGSPLDPSKIEVGDDLFFECSVHANPKESPVSWYLNEKQLIDNALNRIIIINQTLVLQKVTRNASGNYTCRSTNSEGEGVSNIMELLVKYRPICKSNQRRTYGISLNEEAQISCELEAEPPVINFRWEMNRTNEISALPSHRFVVHGSNSTLKYTTSAERDYGTLLCLGQNDLGWQVKPCVFYILQAGPPEPLLNCTLMNLTMTSFSVACQEGYNGGMPQIFTAELYDEESQKTLLNVTRLQPLFNFNDLTFNHEYGVYVYAINIKGRSSPYKISVFTLRPAEKIVTDIEHKEENIFILHIIIGSSIGILILFSIIICFLCFNIRNKKIKCSKANKIGEKRKPISRNDFSEERCHYSIPREDLFIFPNMEIGRQSEKFEELPSNIHFSSVIDDNSHLNCQSYSSEISSNLPENVPIVIHRSKSVLRTQETSSTFPMLSIHSSLPERNVEETWTFPRNYPVRNLENRRVLSSKEKIEHKESCV